MQDSQQSLVNFSVKYKNEKQSFSLPFSTTVLDFTNNLHQVFGIELHNQKLIAHGRDLLSKVEHSATLSEIGVLPGSKFLLIGSDKAHDETLVPDKLILGFEQEEQRQKARQKKQRQANQNTTNPYIGSYQILDYFKNPPPDKAMKLLKKLASDTGIIAVMKKHNWQVGLLREMPPEGKVGIDEVCILGLNENKGQTISLRIRTDDLKGFRNYENVKNVMLHELTHNQFSEHNDDFWKLFRQLQRESESLDWTKSRGHSLSEYSPSIPDNADLSDEDLGHRLGGDNHGNFLPAPELAGLAALSRIDQQPQRPPSPKKETPMEIDEPVLEEISPPVQIPNPEPIEPKIEQNVKPQIQEKIELPKMEKKNEEFEEMISQNDELAVIHEFVNLANQRIDAVLTRILGEIPEISRKSLLQTVYKIVSNLLNFPNEEKYRKISISSKILQEKILRFESGLELLRTLGFREDSTQFIYTRNDPGYLWIVKSKLEQYQ